MGGKKAGQDPSISSNGSSAGLASAGVGVCSDQLTIPPLALLQSLVNNGTLRKGSQDAASGRVVESPTTSDSQSSAPSWGTQPWHHHQSFSHIAAGDMAEWDVFTLEPRLMV